MRNNGGWDGWVMVGSPFFHIDISWSPFKYVNYKAYFLATNTIFLHWNLPCLLFSSKVKVVYHSLSGHPLS